MEHRESDVFHAWCAQQTAEHYCQVFGKDLWDNMLSLTECFSGNRGGHQHQRTPKVAGEQC